MADEPQFPEMPSDADPMALLAFMQRLMGALQRGEDPTPLLADAPPGFQELFLEAQQRMERGELGDLDALAGADALGGLGGFGFMLEDDEAEEAAEEDDAEESDGDASPDEPLKEDGDDASR
jgi:hypothetical protein